MLFFTLLTILISSPTILKAADVEWKDYQQRHTGPDIDSSAVRTCWLIGGTFGFIDNEKRERGYQCVGWEPIWTNDTDHATEFCESRFPYHIINGDPKTVGGNPGTECTFQVNLVCAEGWYQMRNKCYRVLERLAGAAQYTYEEAQKACVNLGATNSLREAQLATFHSPNMGQDLLQMIFPMAWVEVPDWSPYYSNEGLAEQGVFVLDEAWRYSVKEGTLIIPVPGEKYPALCQYTPEMNMAESFLLAELYKPIYPMLVTDLGISFSSSGYTTISQVDSKKYNLREMTERCKGVGRVIQMESWVQSAREEEINRIRDGLKEHRFYLTGSVKNDGKDIAGYNEYDEKSNTWGKTFTSSISGDYSDAHSMSVHQGKRLPSMAAMRAPTLCALHSFTYEISDCKDVGQGFKMVQVDRQGRKTRMCHYIKHDRSYSYVEAAAECEKIGMVLSGFEENQEIQTIRQYLTDAKTQQNGYQDWSHYWLGGTIPCRSDCSVPGGGTALASWDPAVSMENEFLHNYNHAGYPYSGQDGNKYVNYRKEEDALHSHNDQYKAYLICGKYAERYAVMKSAKNTKT